MDRTVICIMHLFYAFCTTFLKFNCIVLLTTCVIDFHILWIRLVVTFRSVNAVHCVLEVSSPTLQLTEGPCPEIQIPLCHDDQQMQSSVNARGCTEFICGECCNMMLMLKFKSSALIWVCNKACSISVNKQLTMEFWFGLYVVLFFFLGL
jgi:hypothetical protein